MNSSIYRKSALFILLALIFPIGSAQAEKANMPEASLTKMATDIVIGEVTDIYTRKEKKDGWDTTYYVAEIKIDKITKGKALKKGGLVYVRYWNRSWIGSNTAPLSTNGHRGLPKIKDYKKVYLTTNLYDGFGNRNTDGGFNVIGANGFANAKK